MPAKFSLLTLAALPIIPVALACGGDDGGGKITVRPDAGKTPDSGPVTCTAAATYGGVQGSAQAAGSDGMMGGTGSDSYQVYWIGRMDANTQPDLLQIALFEGGGPFGGGITPGTVQLTGAEADPTMCYACMVMFTDYHMVGSDSADYVDLYFATGGTLNLTSVSGTFEGTGTNLTLTHYVQSGQRSVPRKRGGKVGIAGGPMTARMGSNGATGKPAGMPRFKLGNRTF